jgi:hypothetical protein
MKGSENAVTCLLRGSENAVTCLLRGSENAVTCLLRGSENAVTCLLRVVEAWQRLRGYHVPVFILTPIKELLEVVFSMRSNAAAMSHCNKVYANSSVFCWVHPLDQWNKQSTRGLKFETVKYGHESCRTQTRERLALARPSGNFK